MSKALSMMHYPKQSHVHSFGTRRTFFDLVANCNKESCCSWLCFLSHPIDDALFFYIDASTLCKNQTCDSLLLCCPPGVQMSSHSFSMFHVTLYWIHPPTRALDRMWAIAPPYARVDVSWCSQMSRENSYSNTEVAITTSNTISCPSACLTSFVQSLWKKSAHFDYIYSQFFIKQILDNHNHNLQNMWHLNLEVISNYAIFQALLLQGYFLGPTNGIAFWKTSVVTATSHSNLE